jgi:hypothetical protein
MKAPRVALLVSFLELACSSEMAAPNAVSIGAPSAEETAGLLGIPDRGNDPAVVAIDVGGVALCGGTLVAPDVVLTARHCVAVVAPDTQCPARAAQVIGEPSAPSLRILVGDDLASAEERARGRTILAPPGDVLCGADVALVLLDMPIDDVRPLSVRATGAAKGEHVRTVAFARPVGGPAPQKLVRDHRRVIDATTTELETGEACGETTGGPALDESTGEIVGIASRPGGPSCAGVGAFDRYTRADAFLSLVGAALGAAGPAKGQRRTKKGPIDMGANCARADDCAAGVCITDRTQEYCSRACDPHDHCPPRFRCKKSIEGDWVCSF